MRSCDLDFHQIISVQANELAHCLMMADDPLSQTFRLDQMRIIWGEVYRDHHLIEGVKAGDMMVHLQGLSLDAALDHPPGDDVCPVDGIQDSYSRDSSARFIASAAMHSSTPRGSAQITSTSSPQMFKTPLRFSGSTPSSCGISWRV